jgi:hypothetical protein
MQVAFIRLNKSLIARDPSNTKSNNKTVFNLDALKWLRNEISRRVDIIVIYTGMNEKNAEQIFRRVVEYAKLDRRKCVLLSGTDLIIDKQFCTDVCKYVEILENKISRDVSRVVFYDFEPLSGTENLNKRGIRLEIKKIEEFTI